MSRLKPIGFWYYPYGEDVALPHPSDLVCPHWLSSSDKAKLIAYLKAGVTYETWRGLSHCRFQCGIEAREMGYRDFTDKKWVWPEGLYHYVEMHDVRLPDDFMIHCRSNHWQIPASASKLVRDSLKLDYSSWIMWAKDVQKIAEPVAPRNTMGRTTHRVT